MITWNWERDNQPSKKNYRKLRNTDSRKNSLPRKECPLIVYSNQEVSPEVIRYGTISLYTANTSYSP